MLETHSVNKLLLLQPGLAQQSVPLSQLSLRPVGMTGTAQTNTVRVEHLKGDDAGPIRPLPHTMGPLMLLGHQNGPLIKW